MNDAIRWLPSLLSWVEPPWPVANNRARLHRLSRSVERLISQSDQQLSVYITADGVATVLQEGDSVTTETWSYSQIREFALATVQVEGQPVQILELRPYNHTPVILRVAPSLAANRIEELLGTRVAGGKASA